mgnify:FL=1
MKKIKYLFLFAFILMPMNIKALDIKDDFNIETTDKISEVEVNGSSVVAGNDMTVNHKINGIDMVFSNLLNYNSTSEYAAIFANTINMSGNIVNDGFIFGNIINFDSTFKVDRDLFIFGNQVVLKGEIKRNVTIYASEIIIEDAKVLGNSNITASKIDIKNSELNNLSYNESATYNSTNSTINSISTVKETKSVNFSTIALSFINNYVNALVIFLALALIVPSLFIKIDSKLKEMSIFNIVSSLGFGLLTIILIPIISILLLISTFASSLGVLLLVLFVISICLSTIFTSYYIGSIIWDKFVKKERNTLLIGLIGITIIKILSIIPIFSSIVTLLSLLFGLSIIIKLFTKDV